MYLWRLTWFSKKPNKRPVQMKYKELYFENCRSGCMPRLHGESQRDRGITEERRDDTSTSGAKNNKPLLQLEKCK